MKISIKKKYIGAFASLLTLVLGFSFIQEFLTWLSWQNFSVLIDPFIFIVSFIYTTSYWLGLRDKERIVDEVSKEISYGDPIKVSQTKEHFWQKVWEEAYTLNFYRRGIKFTSTWSAQNEIEKILSYKNTPNIIKQEFIKRVKND